MYQLSATYTPSKQDKLLAMRQFALNLSVRFRAKTHVILIHNFTRPHAINTYIYLTFTWPILQPRFQALSFSSRVVVRERQPWRQTKNNKRFIELNNGSARALYILVHFLVVLCKTTTWNDQILRILENMNR